MLINNIIYSRCLFEYEYKMNNVNYKLCNKCYLNYEKINVEMLLFFF